MCRDKDVSACVRHLLSVVHPDDIHCVQVVSFDISVVVVGRYLLCSDMANYDFFFTGRPAEVAAMCGAAKYCISGGFEIGHSRDQWYVVGTKI